MNLEELEVKKELKIIFMGTPEFSVKVLEGLANTYPVRAIITQPDRMVGRKREIVPTPVKKFGNENMILVIQPEKIKNHVDEIKAFEPDLIITCAYGQILPVEILEIPRLGCINVHASLLPKLRGGAPIHHAILKGHKKSGITIMYMSKRMDEGDIISTREVDITDIETVSSLHDKLALVGRDLLLDTLPSIIEGTNTRTPQNHSEASYGFNITREDEKIHFDKSKREIYNQIRGLNSWPGAFTKMDNKIMKVWSSYVSNNSYPNELNGTITNIYSDGFGVKVSNGEIVFTEIQIEGKGKMLASSYLNGLQDKNSILGKVLG